MTTMTDAQLNVPQAVLQALLHQPDVLQMALANAGLAPRDLALWARRQGVVPEIEKLAGWLSVGQQPGHYKPLLEVAASHLRAGELAEALPIFRWAYHAWQTAPHDRSARRFEGVKLLALWGECLYRLGQPEAALQRWVWALDVVADRDALARLARTIEQVSSPADLEWLLSEALRRRLPGAEELHRRWQRVVQSLAQEPPVELASLPKTGSLPDGLGVAIMADTANLDMAGGHQFGYRRHLDYGRLLGAAQQHGPAKVKIAFVPDVPETLPLRDHLAQAGFDIDLKRPKRSHGRMVANADTAMAAAAVRWASDPAIGRVELWTGDGDFLKVRQVVAQAWPQVVVAFRSFDNSTAAGIRHLGDDWEPIGLQHLQPRALGDQGQVR